MARKPNWLLLGMGIGLPVLGIAFLLRKSSQRGEKSAVPSLPEGAGAPASSSVVKPAGTLIIADGVEVSGPAGVPVQTYEAHGLLRFAAQGKPRKRVTELVIHETVSSSVASTVEVLQKRGLSVHLILGPDGTLYQHGDLVRDVLWHAAGHNTNSFGVEVVNPYDPQQLQAGLPWTRVIDAPWSWKGRYVLPTPAQAEAVAQLVKWTTSRPAPGIEVPRRWPGLQDGQFKLAAIPEAKQPLPGVLAHQYFGHSDGSWLVLYAWLRLEAGLSPTAAYEEAARRATGSTGSVSVRNLLPVSVA